MTKKPETNETEATEDQDVGNDFPPVGNPTPSDDEEGNEETSNERSPDTDADSKETQNPNAEAKKYRVRLRDAEAERDQLREQLQTLQSEMVNHHIAGGIPDESGQDTTPQLRKPSDLYLFTQTGPADYIGDDGRPDAQKIAEAVSDLAKQRPELTATPERVIIPNAGDHPPKGAPKPSFSAAFGPEGLG